MIRLLLDMGLPRRTADDLVEGGWDVVHIGALGRATAPDVEIVDLARAEQRTIVTLDSDFARIVAVAKAARPSLVVLRLAGLDRRLATSLLRTLVPTIALDLELGCIASVTERGVRLRRLPLT